MRIQCVRESVHVCVATLNKPFNECDEEGMKNFSTVTCLLIEMLTGMLTQVRINCQIQHLFLTTEIFIGLSFI